MGRDARQWLEHNCASSPQRTDDLVLRAADCGSYLVGTGSWRVKRDGGGKIGRVYTRRRAGRRQAGATAAGHCGRRGRGHVYTSPSGHENERMLYLAEFEGPRPNLAAVAHDLHVVARWP